MPEDDIILQQQFRRALSSFEGIILSQIDIKNRLGDRLNYSIQAGIIVLGLIAVSILVLLLTLSSQITRISGVVAEMNKHFISVSDQMHRIEGHMGSMEQRVALLSSVEARMALMDREMTSIRRDMDAMHGSVDDIDMALSAVRTNVRNISVNMDLMNLEVQTMSGQMIDISRPARTMNRMIPFP
ncbi:translation initiation factor 2 [Thiococcus pfennigii]|nr:translation initiation factor 2 [Thiococcus pfennigii]MBK1731503.1 translation initiation factor 2 [Thiococcus pfennigii]